MKKRTLINAILVTFTLIGCVQSKVFTNGDKWIPPDFKASSTTLLIIRTSVSFPKNEKEYLAAEEFMKESYPYPYAFTYLLDTAKFDRTKYRYLLLSEAVNVTPSSSNYTYGVDFYFYDRKSKRFYQSTKKPSSTGLMTFRPVIRTLSARQ